MKEGNIKGEEKEREERKRKGKMEKSVLIVVSEPIATVPQLICSVSIHVQDTKRWS